MANTQIRHERISGIREILSANRTYYVRTDGSDSNTGLVNSAGGAFLTAAKANSVVATIDKNGYDITVQFGAGTWSENITINTGIGDGTVLWKGTLSLLEAVTSATVTIGSNATAGTVTKTGQFTGNTYASKLVYFQTDQTYRVIYTNTNDVLTLADYAPSATTQNIDVYDWGTVISSITVAKPDAPFELEFMKVNGKSSPRYGFSLEVYALSSIIVRYCYLQTAFAEQSSMILYDCIAYDDGTPTVISWGYSATGVLFRCLIISYNTGGQAVSANRGGYILFAGGTINGTDGGAGKATYGVFIWGSACGQTTVVAGSYGYLRVLNCDTGLFVRQTSTFVGSSSISFTGCTTTTSAEAASYGYIG